MKKFWKWMEVRLHNYVNVLNWTLEMVKMVNLKIKIGNFLLAVD